MYILNMNEFASLNQEASGLTGEIKSHEWVNSSFDNIKHTPRLLGDYEVPHVSLGDASEELPGTTHYVMPSHSKFANSPMLGSSLGIPENIPSPAK